MHLDGRIVLMYIRSHTREIKPSLKDDPKIILNRAEFVSLLSRIQETPRLSQFHPD